MKQGFVIFIILMSAKIFSQTNAISKPCSAPESNQFDFWLGSWNLTYNDTVHASNTISRDLDGCVIYEHFNDPTSKLNGNSWSVYNSKTKKWQQTWVDNQGGYIVLTGEMKEGKMILFTEPAIGPKGKKLQYRMTFFNILKESFNWNWESTTDEGATWQPGWAIHYQRKK